MKKGFTLAEVLITLAIIGVVAALTIPSVIVRTQQQEFKTAAKKAYSVLSQAVQLTEVKDGYTFANGGLFVQALINNMNVVKVETFAKNSIPGVAYADPQDDSPYGEGTIFYTADGMAYRIDYIDHQRISILVDVNGDKGPSKISEGILAEASCVGGGYRCYGDYNPEWEDFVLVDLFGISFYEEGYSYIGPFRGYPQ